ncbi:MAG TPA: hypothetical protein ENO05_10225 [Bacteroides sp.]|nr:hypothetical protein [Bacteroides sp.]
MRGIAGIISILILLSGCASDDQSWLSIYNATGVPIYTLPYTSEYTEGSWIQPGVAGDFYCIDNDYLDGYTYFSFYYDSLIVYLDGYDGDPIKFYQDGSTVNYDATLNPFTNPEVWEKREFNRHLPGSAIQTLEEKRIHEHYFSINSASIKSICDTTRMNLNPAS